MGCITIIIYKARGPEQQYSHVNGSRKSCFTSEMFLQISGGAYLHLRPPPPVNWCYMLDKYSCSYDSHPTTTIPLCPSTCSINESCYGFVLLLMCSLLVTYL